MIPTIPIRTEESYRSVPMPATVLTNRGCGDIANDKVVGGLLAECRAAYRSNSSNAMRSKNSFRYASDLRT